MQDAHSLSEEEAEMIEMTQLMPSIAKAVALGLVVVGVAAVGLAAIGCGPVAQSSSGRSTSSTSEPTGTATASAPRTIPPIDAAQPAEVETATFALG